MNPATSVLIVPGSRINTIMHLAQTHLLRDHLGPHNTLEMLWDQFQWAGMAAEVCNLCQWTSLSDPPDTSTHHRGTFRVGGDSKSVCLQS